MTEWWEGYWTGMLVTIGWVILDRSLFRFLVKRQKREPQEPQT